MPARILIAKAPRARNGKGLPSSPDAPRIVRPKADTREPDHSGAAARSVCGGTFIHARLLAW